MHLISFNLPITEFKQYCLATGSKQGNITLTQTTIDAKIKRQQKPKNQQYEFSRVSTL